jgi:hypothetical protein
LQRLADNTGGTYQTAETPEDFSSLFSNVLSTLRTQYVLTYESNLPRDGQMHSIIVQVRTSTQLEGFQEYRIQMPTAASEESEGTTPPTGEPSSATPAPEPLPEPEEAVEEEGRLAAIRDWIQDNVLLAGLAVAAVGLLFLALLIIVIILLRRRRMTVEEEVPLAPPYPPAPAADFDFEPGAAGAADMFETDFAGFGTTAAPPAEEPLAFGTAPSPPPDASPAPAPTVPYPDFQPSPADRTRIFERAPKMPIVGLLIDRDQPDQKLDIAKPVVVIGRSPESDQVVDHNTVSRQHATIKLEGERFYLYDLGSTNGTFVGERQIHEPVAIEDGMTVRFGEKAFVFKVISLEE